MARIERIFADLRARGRTGLMPFLVGGDSDLATTAALLPALERGGACACEIGIPFSDPIADGPVIEAAMGRALETGVTPEAVLETVEAQRAGLSLALIAMVSYSIVYRKGQEAFLERAARAGIDGLIVPDLPLEEADALRGGAHQRDMALALLVAPTTPPGRAAAIARAASGFVYLVARAGTTGERAELSDAFAPQVRSLREHTNLPIAVGFGVSRPEHVGAVTSVADAAVVGSALVRRLAEVSGGPEARAQDVERFTAELAQGLAHGETEAPEKEARP
jgi:tryptophan synthase alpha chain